MDDERTLRSATCRPTLSATKAARNPASSAGTSAHEQYALLKRNSRSDYRAPVYR